MRTLALLALGAQLLFAWGPEGHRLVARLADQMLTPVAHAQITATLAPDETIIALSSWADDVRKDRAETAPWHYVDIPITSAGLDMQRDCPDNNCVIAEIADFRKTWHDPSVSAKDRREALLFLVHFVGDMHQPLHCADNMDEGGNDVVLPFFGEDWKLHSIWDSGVLNHMPEEQMLFAELSSDLTPERRWEWSQGSVAGWAGEAFHIAQENVYGPILRPHPGSALDAVQYKREAEPVVRLQIERAGVRLATILNEAFR